MKLNASVCVQLSKRSLICMLRVLLRALPCARVLPRRGCSTAAADPPIGGIGGEQENGGASGAMDLRAARLAQLRQRLAEEDAQKEARLGAATGASVLRSWANDGGDDPRTSFHMEAAEVEVEEVVGAGRQEVSVKAADAPHRADALSLYRQILRAVHHVPTAHRQAHIRRRARKEFEENRAENDPDQVLFLLQLGNTHLDTIRVQGEHLSQQFEDVRYRDWKT